jgi:hypothetical protein
MNTHTRRLIRCQKVDSVVTQNNKEIWDTLIVNVMDTIFICHPHNIKTYNLKKRQYLILSLI